MVPERGSPRGHHGAASQPEQSHPHSEEAVVVVQQDGEQSGQDDLREQHGRCRAGHDQREPGRRKGGGHYAAVADALGIGSDREDSARGLPAVLGRLRIRASAGR